MPRPSVWLVCVVLVACAPVATPPAAHGVVEVRAVAGPVCPVETVPPDPGCAPRAVVGAPIFIMPADGRDVVVAQATTGDDGLARLDVPLGDYIVTGGEVAGLMGLPSETPITVGAEAVTITLTYDTGIR